jgi:hypothetical protein
MIVATWLKYASNGTTPPQNGNELGWADTRVLCLPANETMQVSRNITQADLAAGAERAGGLTWSMFGIIIVAVLLGF